MNTVWEMLAFHVMQGSTWGKKGKWSRAFIPRKSLDIKPLHKKLLEIQGFPYK